MSNAIWRPSGRFLVKRRCSLFWLALVLCIPLKAFGVASSSCGFQCTSTHASPSFTRHRSQPRPLLHRFAQYVPFTARRTAQRNGKIANKATILQLAQGTALNDAAVQKGIDRIVAALRKDSRANTELGRVQKVTIVLGYGSPQPDVMAVRFNAAFQKSGPGQSSVPLPFGLGQSNVREGRGTMVGQVKASLNMKTGKVLSCSVFRDLGYGRTFDLKV